ncbi:restriction endonuclease [Vibrio agarivorans]|uniref:restriction endonuclease n=1 Tax=Vibrio agarivorans TaxID=153622 RepID=UPI0025B38AC9|nr:restriction endonuclease [Vibrio agarivorans]MDN3662400.1 restriction endonuclease [Vibrio agarivorans]
MARKNEGLLWQLMDAPWWMSVFVSATSYVSLAYIAPNMLLPSDNMLSIAFADIFQKLAPYFAILFIIPAPISFMKQVARGVQFRKKVTKIITVPNNSKAVINDMSWIEFEAFIGEFFRQNGYEVKQYLSHSPDGGVDIELRKNGELSLVQCKHWKTRKVGVQVLREMYGVMLSQQAARMILVTSGSYTSEAKEFAKGKRFWLVDKDELVNMIESGKQSLNSSTPAPPKPNLTCPVCNSTLVIRVAKKGQNKGKNFYGCERFPDCRFTQDIHQNFNT